MSALPSSQARSGVDASMATLQTADKPTIVLVHGGQHSGACWQPTVDALRALDPSAQVLAVDLPGHGNEPGDLATLTIAQCVESVTSQILSTRPSRVMLVGHSMAGITLPGVAARLGSALVQRVVFIACCIPPDGKTVLDTLHAPMNIIASRAARRTAVSAPLPAFIARFVFANGMTREQKLRVVAGLCAESTRVTTEPVDRSAFPRVPTSWVLTQRDRALRPKVQREFIGNLGGVDEVIELDTCHNAMISEPVKLAEILLSRC
ncbi:Pimeloyl-ACP methyl ester carboxylesterase [Paraburkholderia dioscoreae]|uniref:Pimeloyl-ACP methyl ester carboxylesterase n=2 Tax=Paraburkholderia dioscoreae TaxID=2604047 RepID=A0A5Q4ZR42_9BURK|nr:Pimeloyl-ACP methyl ester carboxylesterase [Paraburkholderia dioscoreae]